MKTLAFIISAVVIGTFVSVAQTVSQTATTTAAPIVPLQSVGTISTIDTTGRVMTVTPTGSATPVMYTYGTDTMLLDEAGAVVKVETVKKGAPVTVYYTKDGDKVVVSKVIVRKGDVIEEKTTTTTTTTTTP